MSAYLSILRRHRVVRASAAAIFLYGFAGAATSPYQAVIGIRELGLSNQDYALIALAASVANVVLSILIGALSDKFASYRRPLIVVSAFGVLGYGMIWAIPTQVSFVLAMVGPLAVFHATNSMLFANVRAHNASFSTDESHVVNALMRMMISLSWVLVPGIVGLLLSGQTSMIAAYLIASLLAAACLAVITFWLEPEPPKLDDPLDAIPSGGTGTAQVAPTAGRPDRPAQVRIPHATLGGLTAVLTPALLVRVLGIALLSQVLHVNAAVLPLTLTGRAGGAAGDIGLIVGMVAALEVAFMFFWAWAVTRIKLTTAFIIIAALYCGYLTATGYATAVWHIWLASIIAGFAAAGIISLPIGYLLDLIPDRPGLSASLIAVNMFAGGALGAGIFALGTAIGGYPAAAVVSGVAGVGGALALALLDRPRRTSA